MIQYILCEKKDKKGDAYAKETEGKDKAENKTLFVTYEELEKMPPRRLPSDQAAVRAMNDAFRVFKNGK